jgi:hypothetical protein
VKAWTELSKFRKEPDILYKNSEVFDELKDYQLFKETSALWAKLIMGS